MTKDAALKQALEALEKAQNRLASNRGSAAAFDELDYWDMYANAITAIKEALAQPEQRQPLKDEDAITIEYHKATIKRLENRIDELIAQSMPPPNALQIVRRIRACESEVTAQLVLEHAINAQLPLPVQPEERYFCPRCGKRTADLTTIHTCTPPVAAGSQAFYGFPNEPVSTPNAGGKCVTDGETSPTHTLNSTKTVAVATDTYWMPIDKDTPRSAKLQLLSIGGVAQYGTLGSDPTFFTHWCPVPKKPK